MPLAWLCVPHLLVCGLNVAEAPKALPVPCRVFPGDSYQLSMPYGFPLMNLIKIEINSFYN